MLAWDSSGEARATSISQPVGGVQGAWGSSGGDPLCGRFLANTVRSQYKEVATFKFFVGIDKEIGIDKFLFFVFQIGWQNNQ